MWKELIESPPLEALDYSQGESLTLSRAWVPPEVLQQLMLVVFYVFSEPRQEQV